MLTWLAADLAATSQQWVLAFWHHPPYTKGTHDSDDPGDSGGRMVDMRENVVPILEAGGVDVVFLGHSHTYERSFLVDGAYDTPTTAPGHIVDGGDGAMASDGPYMKSAGLNAREGTVYVVAGHGGRPIGGAGTHPLMYFSEVAYGSCLVSVNHNVLRLRNVRDDGVISDRFTLIKGDLGGDFDGDADADGVDFLTFSNCFNESLRSPLPGCVNTSADFDGDGDVDGADFLSFANCYNESNNLPLCIP
jgi:hypothetical protein